MKKIKSYKMFLEGYSDNPESYSKTLLNKLQRKINKYFGVESETRVVSFDDYIETDETDNTEEKSENLTEMGLELLDTNVYTQSPMVDTLRVIFSNEEARYDLYIIINLKDAIKDTQVDEFSISDIKFAHAKLKKYITLEDEIELLGELDKKIQIGEISQDFIIDFKVELDDFFDDEDDDDFDVMSEEELEEEENKEDEELEDEMNPDGEDENDEFSDDEPEEFVDDEI